MPRLNESQLVQRRQAEWLRSRPRLEIPEDAWTNAGSDEHPESRLHVTIWIGDTPMHLEAYKLADRPEQRFADLYFTDEDSAFFTITGGAVLTTTICGSEYVLLATPHGD